MQIPIIENVSYKFDVRSVVPVKSVVSVLADLWAVLSPKITFTKEPWHTGQEVFDVEEGLEISDKKGIDFFLVFRRWMGSFWTHCWPVVMSSWISTSRWATFWVIVITCEHYTWTQRVWRPG